MSNKGIKILDPSQINYIPEDGEVIQTPDGEYLMWKDDAWMKFSMEGSGMNMGLYDLNKSIINQLPNLTKEDLKDTKPTIDSLHAKFNNEFYMLYGKEISYFSLFKLEDSKYFSEEVLNCLRALGEVKCIDYTEANDALEIWVTYEEDVTCLYLFPYDSGLIVVGENI